jgi:hypothetical protein
MQVGAAVVADRGTPGPSMVAMSWWKHPRQPQRGRLSVMLAIPADRDGPICPGAARFIRPY